MKHKIRMASAATLIFACGCGVSDITGTEAAPIVVRLDAACVGTVLFADILLDGQNIGRVVPGNSTEKSVAPGDHRIQATSDNAFQWGPFTRTLSSNESFTQVLTCD